MGWQPGFCDVEERLRSCRPKGILGKCSSVTPDQRSALMSRIRGKDTGPEMAVRRQAHLWGFRFRLHRHDLPGRPDLVFPRLRKAVLVHGCFWHHHSDPSCRNATLPKTRAEWWHAKLFANVARDIRNLKALQDLGWDVLVLWECEIRSGAFTSKLELFLNHHSEDFRQHLGSIASGR
jgi:DNA mismatch endonuclease (patch repair protein)